MRVSNDLHRKNSARQNFDLWQNFEQVLSHSKNHSAMLPQNKKIQIEKNFILQKKEIYFTYTIDRLDYLMRYGKLYSHTLCIMYTHYISP